MKLMDIRKVGQGEYLAGYVATYKNAKGRLKEYELASRNGNLTTETFGHTEPAGVGMIIFNEDKTKILLQKEFRLACNNWVYNFPGGLIDEGETVYEAATRELKEETGLDMTGIITILYPSYSAVGLSDEQVYTVIGKAEGTFKESTSADEEIEAAWYTKRQIGELFDQAAPMAQRTQSFLWMWCYGNVFD